MTTAKTKTIVTTKKKVLYAIILAGFIGLVTAFFLGKHTGEKQPSPYTANVDAQRAIDDAQNAADAAAQAAKSAQKAADSTRETAKSAASSAKDTAQSAQAAQQLANKAVDVQPRKVEKLD